MIADKVFGLSSFQRQYKNILVLSSGLCIPKLIWNEDKEALNEKISWDNVLGIASILSYSDDPAHLDAALRIAQTCLQLDTNSSQKSAAGVILQNLTNVPAIALAKQRGLIGEDFESGLSLPFKIQSNRARISNSIIIGDSVVSVNRFQKRVFDVYRQSSSMSISAPTSAGKSFVLYQILLDFIKKGRSNIAFIVPTRALISQVEDDLRHLIKIEDISDVQLTTVPSNAYIDPDKTNLFVFTQERLHWLDFQPGGITIDLLIVDEAHKIDNGNRGILLQSKIEDTIANNPNVRVFFSSPFTSNPEMLLSDYDLLSENNAVNTEFVAVNQNLLYVRQKHRKPKEWQIDLVYQENVYELGHIFLKDRPTTQAKKIALISEAMSTNSGGSIVYANGAADAEKYAMIIKDLVQSKNLLPDIKEFKDLIQSIIHRNYALAKVIDSGIGFHYGNMPLIVRRKIEDLFRKGAIKFLVCTSTLLEGVNLPATAVFVRKPTRGRRKPLNENDFWNLAGRAGRWGQEFSGNIVCIEPNDWEIKPSPNKRKQKIQKAITILEDTDRGNLIGFIKARSPRDIAETRQDLEFAFNYYYRKYLRGELERVTKLSGELSGYFDSYKENIQIPENIIARNPGISPIAQQELYNYFETKGESIEDLIPVYPEDENSFEEYTKLVGRIGKTLAKFPPQLNTSRAVLLIQWMTGKPLSYIISSSYANYQQKGSNKKLDVVIRETMDNVENFARFRFAKESSCYIDILRYYLRKTGKADLVPLIPDLSLWLEFGVSQKTQLSLLSMGLSRNTTIILSEFITKSDLEVDAVIRWLNQNDYRSLNLSTIAKDEIDEALSNNK